MTNDIFLLVKLNQKNEFRTTASFEIKRKNVRTIILQRPFLLE